jgi:hypothetical protein
LLEIEGRFEGDLTLYGITAGDGLQLDKTEVSGITNLEGARVGGTVQFRDSKLRKVGANRLRGDGDVQVTGTSIAEVTLVGARVEGALRLSGKDHGRARWVHPSTLDLRSARFARIEISPSAWPEKYWVEGLEYRLATDEDGRAVVLADIRDWLGGLRRETYAPGSFKRVADILDEAGRGDDAREIRILGRTKERQETDQLGKWIWLWVFGLTVGFGYQPMRILCFAVPLILIGWSAARRSTVGRWEGFGFFYSLDRFLPIIQLRRKHGDVDLEYPFRWYFYLHHIAGYLVGSVLVAGLASIL